MIPTYPAFKNIDLTDKVEIESFLAAYPPYSDYNFTSLWSWDTGEKVQVSRFENHLIIRFSDYVTGELFYSILGTERSEIILHQLLEQCKKEKLPAEIRLVPESVVAAGNGTVSGDFDIIEDHDNHDYVLSVPGLVNLEGSEHSDIRYFIGFFKQRHPLAQIRHLDVSQPVVQTEILTLADTWATYKGVVSKNHAHERLAIQRHFTLANTFPNTVYFVGLYEEGALIAFGSYEIISKEYALAHFQKALRQYKGIYQYLWHHILLDIHKHGMQYLNFEQDLGIPTLRKAKQAMRPVLHLKKYIIRPKQISASVK